ncbi:uncharacterized protein A4U43_C01F24780 [Asparagus officinalis]|uniref:Uncharacterized protein n=1 Tax=Asparagus officinalis TaxID=4686 RepID=A0A5P1FVD2_ASPOF|nr:uncharacterized protein A4U43_C01F24780 [Asparagus officinalis]
MADQKSGDAQPGEKSSANANSSSNLSEVLSAKLRKCCKAPSPSLTCLRLDTEKSHIGVWQKRAGARADSNWVMTVQLGKMEQPAPPKEDASPSPSSSAAGEGTSSQGIGESGIDEEERLALQMIEELLNRNCPNSPAQGQDNFFM